MIASSEMLTLWCASKVSRRPRRIMMACATVGSGTVTGWKRRSSAASFSMYFWYSLSVVAPIRFSSPRAIIGLKTLATSSPPSPPPWPAPTMVCTSSMNRISSPWCSEISFSTFCTRSSNSPRYLAPATMALILSSTRRLSRKVSGTSPATMRCASPRRWRSCPRPARRSAPGCSSCAGPAPRWWSRSPAHGRSPGRACRHAPSWSGHVSTCRVPACWSASRRGHPRRPCRPPC